MAKTIGQTLQNEREKRGLSISDVAHDTRIHADTIRGLEADDYSVFSSTTYARSFLQLYSRHLEVDAGETLRDFTSVAEDLNSGGFSYLESVTDAIEPGETIRLHGASDNITRYGKSRNPPFPIVLTTIVCLLLLMIPVFYFIGKKANSAEEAASILKETISSRGENLVGNDQAKDSENNPAESDPPPGKLASSTDQADDATPLPSENPPRHRFPRPLPKSEPVPSPPSSVPTSPLRAIPIRPENSPKKREP